MTGIAALALSAGFTSCSHDVDPLSQDEINQIETQKILQNYEQAFVKHFGQPAANQTWGFGASKARTRSYNVQGNLWHTEGDGGFNLKYDAPVTTEEKNLVFNYVNNSNQVETVDQISFTKYWVSQIWNGNSDANANGEKAPTSTSYRNQNGTTTEIIGGAQMDKLEIKETADGGWIHCNNFNSANNNDWKEDGEGGRTLMIESGTYSFRYTNSQSSYLSEKYIIVPGAKIDPSLAGFYYVCFDFERGLTETEKAQETSYGTCSKWISQATDQNPDAGYWQANENWTLTGFYNDATSADLKSALETQKGTQVKDIEFKGYLYGDKYCDGDGNYTDWIVRISPAEVNNNYVGRVMAEDLSVTENSDFDFNDVVFDWKPVTGGIEVQLVAAGGTLPLRIGDGTNWVEVHQRFGHATNEMINTNAGPTATAQPFTVAVSSIDDVKIEVSKDGGNTYIPLTAPQGKAASKINVDPGTPYCTEFQDIDLRWPENKFSKWVAGGAEFWK